MELKSLEKRPFFTTAEAKEHGISPRMLNYYVSKGEITRVARGVYQSASYDSSLENLKWEDLAIAAKNIKGGVICLTSALVYHDITDEIMRLFWIAVANDHSKAKFPKTRIVRMRNMKLGVKEINMGGIQGVKIFDVERTIIDSFRYLSFETAMKALKLYLKGETGKPNVKKLLEYAGKLRASKVREYITALMVS